ncbi:MAG: hypothetical protein EPN88_02985 [Bacteroidetes bacterium]|nr:MAG: hypothetical protein EPN88_02985 [Bacteroidota bacterium]
MMNLKKIAVVLILLSGTAFYVSGQTLKERIDQAREVKVYFRNRDIEHNPNTSFDQASQKMGTSCEKFNEITPLPEEYINVVKQITEMLNKGFNTTVFVEGDLTYLNSLPVNSVGDLDWIRLGEPLTFFVSTSGHYSVNNFPGTGRENTMEVESYLYVYSVTAGKLKTLSSNSLAWKQTPPIRTQKCDDYAWFVKNIPPTSLVEPFKTSVIEKTLKFIEKEMEKYEKAMKKKK